MILSTILKKDIVSVNNKYIQFMQQGKYVISAYFDEFNVSGFEPSLLLNEMFNYIQIGYANVNRKTLIVVVGFNNKLYFSDHVIKYSCGAKL